MAKTKLYALDFDGVICDSAIETGITGWKVATQIWTDMPAEIPANILELFRQVRPVMETGYEAVLIMRQLFEGVSAQQLLTGFSSQLRHLINRDEINISNLKQRFGETRDQWIADNLAQWIEMNPLFTGISAKLSQINHNNLTIITTKQERFVEQILIANKISLNRDRIYGLDRKQSKAQILSDLLNRHPDHSILFVEDRLPTLNNIIADKRLSSVTLYFADWGYNTLEDKQMAANNPAINSLNLDQFCNL